VRLTLRKIMNEIPVVFFLWAGACLFATGFSMLLLKRNAIFVLMGVELMLNAANLNLIAFSRQDALNQGLMMGIFVLVVGVCEMAVALALIIQVYRQLQHIDIGRFKSRN
jgi:NADH:ubiquinone oxidoreductase subunit K